MRIEDNCERWSIWSCISAPLQDIDAGKPASGAYSWPCEAEELRSLTDCIMYHVCPVGVGVGVECSRWGAACGIKNLAWALWGKVVDIKGRPPPGQSEREEAAPRPLKPSVNFHFAFTFNVPLQCPLSAAAQSTLSLQKIRDVGCLHKASTPHPTRATPELSPPRPL